MIVDKTEQNLSKEPIKSPLVWIKKLRELCKVVNPSRNLQAFKQKESPQKTTTVSEEWGLTRFE